MNPTKQHLYVGIDVHKGAHAVSVTDCFENVLLEKSISNSEKDLESLLREINQLSERKKIEPVFGLEDGYSYGQALARFLTSRNYQVKTVHPVLVDRLRRRSTHPEKTDFLDAKGVAKTLIREGVDNLPTYAVNQRTENAKILQELTNDREYLVKESTRIKNQLHRLLYMTFGNDNYQHKFKSLFNQQALKYWKRCSYVKDQGQGLLTRQIKRKVKRLESLNQEIKQIEAEMDEAIDASRSNLKTMPGCGTIITASLLAEVKDINRFKNSSAFAKYAGLAPREFSSGKRVRHRKTKSGNRKLNTAIHRIALTQIGNRGTEEAKAYFQKKVSEGKTKREALTCLKRRIANIVFAMLKNNSIYQRPVSLT